MLPDAKNVMIIINYLFYINLSVYEKVIFLCYVGCRRIGWLHQRQ